MMSNVAKFAELTLSGEREEEWLWFLHHREGLEKTIPRRRFWSITNVVDEDGLDRGSVVVKGYQRTAFNTGSSAA